MDKRAEAERELAIEVMVPPADHLAAAVERVAQKQLIDPAHQPNTP